MTNEINKSAATPLPYRKLFGAYVLLICEAVSTTSFFSYISPFIIFLGVTDKPEEVGFYGGYIASCFSAAQFLSSFFWGKMSDKFGRKPILLIGSIGSIISVLCIGVSWSLPVLIASRSINGLLNGNIGVVKTYIGECTDKSNQVQAFGWIGVTWGLGSILGPSLGGLLSDPATNYPNIFGNSSFLKKYPYILPNLLIASITMVGCAFTYFFMNETLNVKKSKSINMSNLKTKAKYTTLNNSGDLEDDNEINQLQKNVEKINLSIGRFEEDTEMGQKDLIKNSNASIKLNQNSSEYSIHQEESTINSTNVILIDEDDNNGGGADENENEVLNRQLLDESNNNSGSNGTPKNEDEEYDLARDKAHFEDISLGDENGNFLKKSYTLFKNKLFKKSQSMGSIKSSQSYHNLKQVNSELDLNSDQELKNGNKKKFLIFDCSTGDSNTNIFKNKLVMATTFLYCFVGFNFTLWDEAFPLWAFSPENTGGLDMNGKDVGVCGTIGGISVVAIQLFLIKPTIRKLGIIKTFSYGNFFAVLSFFSFPLLNYVVPFKERGTGGFISFWAIVALIIIFRNIAAQLVFTPVMTLINNSAVVSLRGSANGWGQSLVALTRTVAPTLASVLLSWSMTNNLSFPFNHFFVFIFMSLCSFVPFIGSKFLPVSLNAPIEEDESLKNGNGDEEEMQIPVFE